MADHWQKVLNVMTPDNLDVCEVSTYFEIADCLGIGPKYKRIHGQNPGINEPPIVKLSNMMSWWKATQTDFENTTTNFIMTLERESKKKGYNFNLLIAELKKRTGIPCEASLSNQSTPLQTAPVPTNLAVPTVHAGGNVTVINSNGSSAPIDARNFGIGSIGGSENQVTGCNFGGSQPEKNSSTGDEKLKKELERYDIGMLYTKLQKVGVNINILWRLNDDAIKQCGLSEIEKLQYKTALEKHAGENEQLKSISSQNNGSFGKVHSSANISGGSNMMSDEERNNKLKESYLKFFDPYATCKDQQMENVNAEPITKKKVHKAICIFNDYNTFEAQTNGWQKLGGVYEDKDVITKMLKEKNYEVMDKKNENYIEQTVMDLLIAMRQETIGRLHFHFSGHGINNQNVVIPKTTDDVVFSGMPVGECLVGNNGVLTPILVIRKLLTLVNPEIITITLDCCRNLNRGQCMTQMIKFSFVPDIPRQDQLKMAILQSTCETLASFDKDSLSKELWSLYNKGTQISIGEMDKMVNKSWKDRGVEQSCIMTMIRTEDEWDKLLWPL